MVRRGTWAQYSSAEMRSRIGLALVALLLAGASVLYSLAQVVARGDPATAYMLAPYSGRITAVYASKLSEIATTVGQRARADDFARRALQRDATAVPAIATLGIDAEMRGDVSQARRAFAYARSLSRRDIRTQLWSIEDAVRREDIAGALDEYDVTLRVLPRLSEMLYPVLATASSDPAIRPELIRVLARRAPWGESFISYMGRAIPDPPSTSVLFSALKQSRVTVPQPAWTGLINALIESRRYDDAWSTYARVRPGADRQRARSLALAGSLEAPSLLDWITLEDGGTAATIQKGVFDFAVPASVGGPVLRQLQLLRPGQYRLSGHSANIDLPDNARPYWMLTCRQGAEVGRVTMTNSAAANGLFSGFVTVPADCPVQELVLIVPPTDTIGGTSGQIDRFQLDPAG